MNIWESIHLRQIDKIQAMQIQSLSRQAHRSFSHEDRIAALEEEVAHLKLVLAAAVQLLMSKNVFSGEDLAKQTKDIVAAFGQEEGKLDGQLREDGQVVPPPPPPPTPLEELAKAMEEPPGRPEAPGTAGG